MDVMEVGGQEVVREACDLRVYIGDVIYSRVKATINNGAG